MPPKKPEVSKKTEAKKKEKIIEDKTFGMKNKKGAKQQKFIQIVQQQVTNMGRTGKPTDKDKLTKKEEKKKAIEELNMLFKPVEQKIGKGTDPKSVLCAFFKAGQCTKGDKCKFSHDLAVERKQEKRSLYEDMRDDSNDTMDNWDEEKLIEVINKKHGELDKVKPKTAIVCRYFLDAVELGKYGWFWSCPNGENCIYRHCLPQGFERKSKKKEEKGDTISLEDLIEKERAALTSGDLTRVTFDSFLKWKERKKQEKIKNAMAATEKKKSNFASGKLLGISGKELFEFNPDLIRGDDDEADEGSMYDNRENDDGEVDTNEVIREVNFDTFAETMEGYVELPQQERQHHSHASNGPYSQHNGKVHDGSGESSHEVLEGAVGPDPEETDEPIDENLFDGEDLDIVEEELENLNIDG